MKRPLRCSIGVVSLGCAKNLVDSEHMMAVLAAEGMRLAPSPEKADIVIVNTCGFIRGAKEESIDAILEVCESKKSGPCRAVIVAGCLPQRYGAELKQALPEVDAFVGLDELDRIGEIVRKLMAGERALFEVAGPARRLFEPRQPRVLLTGGTYAYIKIAEGCNHCCAFCAIPMIRGRHRSRQVEEIVKEAEHLLEHGVAEINLISQDTTSYGRDLEADADLPALLRALGGIGGQFWIRLLYGHPNRVTDRLLETMGAVSQVCRYLDVPIQHVDPLILRSMRRQTTIDVVSQMPERIRRKLPGVAIRTTCLVGYPGETAAQFQRLLDYVKAAQFDHLGVFAYSPEENTPAFDMPDQVAAEVAEARRAQLMLAQQGIVRSNAEKLIGQTDLVLIEQPSPDRAGVWIGRSYRQAPEVDGEIIVSGLPVGNHAGAFITARYTACKGYDVLAEATQIDPRDGVRRPADL